MTAPDEQRETERLKQGGAFHSQLQEPYIFTSYRQDSRKTGWPPAVKSERIGLLPASQLKLQNFAPREPVSAELVNGRIGGYQISLFL